MAKRSHKGAGSRHEPDREARMKEALRANLRRRKAAAAALKPGGDGAETTPEGPAGED